MDYGGTKSCIYSHFLNDHNKSLRKMQIILGFVESDFIFSRFTFVMIKIGNLMS